jgi:hypothetical protein
VSPTPDAIRVTLTDPAKEWWEPFVVPTATLIAALVGGIGGVLIGGRMNRATLTALEDARELREDRIDAIRAEREHRLDETRANRERIGEQRRALGALVLFEEHLLMWAAALRNESRPGRGPLAALMDLPDRVRPEDQHAAAMWVSTDAWVRMAAAFQAIEITKLVRAQLIQRRAEGGEVDGERYREHVNNAAETVTRTLALIDDEKVSLREAINTPGPVNGTTPQEAAAPP